MLVCVVSQAGFEPLSVVTSLESIELATYNIDSYGFFNRYQ